jgi:hypothetical protein
MRFFAQLSVLLSFALLWCSVSASSAHQVNRRHGKRLDADLAVRAPGDVDMYKRDYANSRLTYYAVGLGACGTVNQPSDFVCAQFKLYNDLRLTLITIDSCTEFSSKNFKFLRYCQALIQ